MRRAQRSRWMMAAVVGVALVVAACGSGSSGGFDAEARPLPVVAGLAPLAAAVQWAGGDLVEVTTLAPPGVEPHDLELTTRDVDAIGDAALLVYVGGDFQPAVAAAADRAYDSIDVAASGESGEAGEPHVWLDPMKMTAVVRAVGERLARLAPEEAEAIAARVKATTERLAELDREIGDGLAACDRRTFITAHAAFGAFAERYDLDQRSIAGASPEAEPDPKTLATLADQAKALGVTTVFAEPLQAPDVAEALAAEAGLTVAVLDPIESAPAEAEAEDPTGEFYFSVMRENLAALRTALGCA